MQLAFLVKPALLFVLSTEVSCFFFVILNIIIFVVLSLFDFCGQNFMGFDINLSKVVMTSDLRNSSSRFTLENPFVRLSVAVSILFTTHASNV